jgi:hypothetical protein
VGAIASHSVKMPAIVNYGFTRGLAFVEGFVGLDGSVDRIGWQYQGSQFRLAVITGGASMQDRRDREEYVARRYAPWFNFDLLEAIVGLQQAASTETVRGGWRFHGYNPDFVYRYRRAPELTCRQLVDLGVGYLERAASILAPTGVR